MVWERCNKQSLRRGLKASLILRESFYIFTLALLSLLLPLSFLLLARLSRVKYFLTIIPNTAPPVSYILSLFLHTNPTILRLLVSLVSVTALVHVVTGRVPILINSESTSLHETMVHWSRVFVRPVVDDTIFGGVMNERWVERAVIGASYGGLWWWRLREEAEGLLLMVDVKGEFSIGTRIADNLSCCLYYFTVTVAAVRLAKGLVWFVEAVCCCSRRKASYEIDNGGCSLENSDCKV
ncbi:hypothetical protein Sjap_006947 [Stephania japonica]|uniref:Uncharacterized protein n=1 Tax=Stephania japonica TaxID=461633 RepID=A0AAP0K8C5_9MAGN